MTLNRLGKCFKCSFELIPLLFLFIDLSLSVWKFLIKHRNILILGTRIFSSYLSKLLDYFIAKSLNFFNQRLLDTEKVPVFADRIEHIVEKSFKVSHEFFTDFQNVRS